jgi:hypothetical protein
VESDASGAAQLAGVPYGARDFIIQVPGMPPARVRLSVEGSMRVPVSLTGESAPRDFGQWRTNNFTAAELADPSISGADADPDRDGLRNLQEFAADTSPLNAGPRPAGFAPRLERGGPGQLRFRIDESSDARVYDLYWRTNLLTGTWQKLGPRVMGTGTNLEITVAVSNGFKRCFYRPVVSLP